MTKKYIEKKVYANEFFFDCQKLDRTLGAHTHAGVVRTHDAGNGYHWNEIDWTC